MLCSPDVDTPVSTVIFVNILNFSIFLNYKTKYYEFQMYTYFRLLNTNIIARNINECLTVL
jgi:hypothetical protein